MEMDASVSKYNIPLRYGITLHNNHIVVIDNSDFIAIGGDKSIREDIRYSTGVKTPIADIVIIYHGNTLIGRLISCKYKLTNFRVLNHAALFVMSTRHTGHVYSDDAISVHTQDDIMIVTMCPDYALDADSAKEKDDG